VGIVRSSECAINQAAGKLGVAPEVFHIIEPVGYIVTSFIDGRVLPHLDWGCAGMGDPVFNLGNT
jgi:hypothetical protein